MVDWVRHYDVIYNGLSVAGVLTTDDSASYDLRVIDKTMGIEAGDGVNVSTIAPVCDIRATEFLSSGLDRESLKDASIAFNGKTWNVVSHEIKPSPLGEAVGQIRLFLSEADV